MKPGQTVVLGATSQVGVFAIPRLLAAGQDVLAVSRSGRPAWYPVFSAVRWIRPEALHSGVVDGVTTLLSAGPIAVAADLLEECPHLERAVVFSTSSVFSKLGSHDRREKRQMQDIIMEEARLAAACESHDIALSLFRPTLIYGCGMDGNVSWLARWIERFGFMPVAGQAAGLRQPVHADDLAAVAVTALTGAAPAVLDVPLCGGSTLSFRAMVEKIFSALDRPVRIISLPGGLFAALTSISRFVPGLRAVRPEMVRREAVDLVFDDSAARELLGYAPRPFEPGPADLRLPERACLEALAANPSGAAFRNGQAAKNVKMED